MHMESNRMRKLALSVLRVVKSKVELDFGIVVEGIKMIDRSRLVFR